MRLLLLLVLCLSTALPATAQQPSCVTGTAEADLSANNVLARVFNTGSLFFGNTTNDSSGYLVPKESGNSPLFAAGLWVGGKVDGELRVAAARYDTFEFWPGPLGDEGLPVNPADCSAYDRIYSVSREDIETYEGNGTPTADLAEWPIGLGAPTLDVNGDPVEATSLDRVIDLDAGERPAIKGEQSLWWLMNDAGNAHDSTDTPPLGVEVRVLAYAFDGPGGYANTTFYDIGITYKGSEPVEDTYLSVFADPDLGDAADDYIGSDPERGLGFVYNANNTDAQYGTPPPALGFDLLSSPNGEDGEPLGVTSVMYFIGGGPPGASDPMTGEEYFNIQQGVWTDGTPMTAFGSGYQTDGPITTFAFSGHPPEFWSELDIDGNGSDFSSGDRRLVPSSGPFTLGPGEEQSFTLAILWALGDDYLDSVAELKQLSDAIQADFDGGILSAEDEAAATGFSLAPAYPNPFETRTALRVALAAPSLTTVEVYDVLGRRMEVLLSEVLPAGTRDVTWSPGASVPSGIYFVRMVAGEAAVTRAVVLQR